MLPKHLVSLCISRESSALRHWSSVMQRQPITFYSCFLFRMKMSKIRYVSLRPSLSYSHLKPNLVDPNFPKLASIRQALTYRSSNAIFASFFPPPLAPSFLSFPRIWTNHGTRTYNNLITFPPCRYRDNNYALMARGWNDIMHPLKARKRHCFDASVSH